MKRASILLTEPLAEYVYDYSLSSRLLLLSF
jgi:hypothetical protein